MIKRRKMGAQGRRKKAFAARPGGLFTGSRTLSRVYQGVVVFGSGDRKNTACGCGAVRVVEMEAGEQEGGQ